MRKKYYVEVTGLGENGAAELRNAGVPDQAILVVEDVEVSPALTRAIMNVAAVGMDRMRSEDSNRIVVAARILMAHYLQLLGISPDAIGHVMNKDSKRMRWYINEFENKMVGDRMFIGMKNRIDQMLAKDPQWSIVRPETGRRPKQAIRKGKCKPKSRKPILSKKNKLVPKITKEMAEARQLKIQW